MTTTKSANRKPATSKREELLRKQNFEEAIKSVDAFYEAVSYMRREPHDRQASHTDDETHECESLREFIAEHELLLLAIVPEDRAAIQKVFAEEYATKMISPTITRPAYRYAYAEIMLRKLECQCLQVNMINGDYWCHKSFDRETELRRAVDSWRSYFGLGVYGAPPPVR